MDLLDRYVHAVRTYLPKNLPRSQQDDIINELSENLRARMDDREADLGRPLDEAEQEAILQRHGHPMIVAGRYQPNQEARLVFGRQLIGPALFPMYLRVLSMVMGISLAIYAVVVAALAVSGNARSFGDVMTTVAFQILIQCVVITGIFTAADRSLPTMRWSAQRLPAPQPVARQTPRVSRLESIAQIVGIIVVVVWLWLAFDHPSLLFGPALDAYQLAPVWQQVALPTLLVLAVSVAQAVVNLFRPEWMAFRRVVRLGTDLAGLGILLYLLRADQWVVLAQSASAGSTASINEFVRYGLLSTLVGFILVALVDAWKLMRGERRQRQRQPQVA